MGVADFCFRGNKLEIYPLPHDLSEVALAHIGQFECVFA